MSYINPGSMAFSGFTCPAPMAKTPAGLLLSMIGFPVWSVTSAVVIIADLIAAGVHVGLAEWMRAAIPLMWGQAIEVPDMTVKFTLLESSGRPEGPRFWGQAAMMFTPGAMISGLSMVGLVKLGPLEENWATAYALVFPITVPPNSILSMGVLEDSMQFFNWIDSAKPIKLTVVNRHLSPLKGVMIKAIVPFLMLDAQESLKTM